MSQSRLIVNADDSNLTPSVLRGVLRAHDEGIVTSTTLFANLTLTGEMRSALAARRPLGVGVHLNITRGVPVSGARDIRSILAGRVFGKHEEEFYRHIDRPSLYTEYRAQIERFEDWWGSPPTHLDTHHHLHRFTPVFEVLLELAEEYSIPIRLSEQVNASVRRRLEKHNIRLADHLIGDLDASRALNKARLSSILAELPDGVTEIMAHPGEVDDTLRAESSWAEVRAQELDALT